MRDNYEINEAVLDQQELDDLGYGKDSVRAKAIDGILVNADRVEYNRDEVLAHYENITFIVKADRALVAKKVGRLIDDSKSKYNYFLELSYKIGSRTKFLGYVGLGSVPYYGDAEKLAKINKKIAKYKLSFY